LERRAECVRVRLEVSSSNIDDPIQPWLKARSGYAVSYIIEPGVAKEDQLQARPMERPQNTPGIAPGLYLRVMRTVQLIHLKGAFRCES
jgi:hypothetical protein